MNKDCKLASDRLKEALTRADMKPAELADRSGINRGTISQYYNGKHIPTNINASKIAKVLHVDPAWLMGLPSATDYSEATLTPSESAHLSRYRALDAEDQDTVDGLTESLLSKSKYHTAEDSGQTGAA